jgi:uncharacterized repeat protein (TIGR01451 family)
VFSDNTSGDGGALTLTDSTVVGNSASAQGGAVYAGAYQTTLVNDTITANQAPSGAGIYASDAIYFGFNMTVQNQTTVANTIVAGNFDGPGQNNPDDITGFVTANYDLIGADANATLQAGSGNNLLGVTDPGLGALASNGGPTETCALLPYSAAIDAGSTALAVDTSGNPLTTDQRGLARVVGPTVDVGAAEFQNDLAVTLAPVPATVYAGDDLTYTLTVTNNGPDAAAPVVTDMLPGGTLLQAWTSSAGGWSLAYQPGQSAATLTPLPGQFLAAGTSVTFTLTVQVTAPPGAVLTSSAAAGPTNDDTNPANNAATSGQTTVLAKPTSTTGLTSSAANYTAVFNQAVTFTVTVSGAAGTPTGTVELNVNGNPVSGQTLDAGGQAVFQLTGLDAGSYDIQAVYSGDGTYLGSTADQSLQVTPATPTIVVQPVNVTYDGQAHTTTAEVFGVGGVDLGPAVLTYSSGLAPVNAGSYVVTASYAGSLDYAVATATGSVVISPATLTVTANNVSRVYGVANPAFSVTYSGFISGETGAVLGGSPTLSTAATGGSAPGSYAINVAAGSLTAANYTLQFVTGTLTVTPAPLSATGLNLSATAGAPFNGVVATFTNADPFGSAASYTAVITWGDGTTSAGVVSGSGSTLSVSGTHTYAAPGKDMISVQISHKLGYTTTARVGGTATVTSLGLNVQRHLAGSIGFWDGKNGQALVSHFNGGAAATALSAWLAATFPDLYGANAGADNLTGKTNAQVATFFQSLYSLSIPRADAQVLAMALNVYATTSSLGGSAGTAYGFTVSATGLGARLYNVGGDGAAFGVANRTTLNVYEMLLAVDWKAVAGILYGGNATLRQQVTSLFNALDQAGAIA